MAKSAQPAPNATRRRAVIGPLVGTVLLLALVTADLLVAVLRRGTGGALIVSVAVAEAAAVAAVALIALALLGRRAT